MQKLRAGGFFCFTGVGSGGITSRMSVADLSAGIVLKNLVLVGSVNANKRHWFKAGEALARAGPGMAGPIDYTAGKAGEFPAGIESKTRRHQGRHPIL